MRHIGITCVLTIFLLVSVCTGQQTSTASPSTEKKGAPTPPPGPVIGGMGTVNYIPIWAAPTFLLNSVIYQASGNIGIGTTTPVATLDVNGGINSGTTYQIGGATVLNSPVGGTNIFVGQLAGANNIGTGNANTFAGIGAGQFNTSGVINTFLGYEAGNTNTTGGGNVFIGMQAGVYNQTGGENIYIGTSGPTNNESGAIRLGFVQTSAFIAGIYGLNVGGVPVQINSNGQLGAQTSSLRFKEQVRDMGDSTSALMKLRPVTFFYKPQYDDGSHTLQYGLIAEEVATVYPELVAYDNDGQPYSVRYQYLSSMLLNEVQKQHAVIATQQDVIKTQQEQVNAQQQQMKAQQQQIEQMQQRLSRLETLIANK